MSSGPWGVDHFARSRGVTHLNQKAAAAAVARYREECLAGARRVYLAASYRSAVKRFRQWAGRWRATVPKVVASLAADLEELLAHMQVLRKQRELWVKVRTTNVIERLFRELRKRIRPMCMFADGASCDRLVYALFMKTNKQWEDRPLWGKPTKKAKQFTLDTTTAGGIMARPQTEGGAAMARTSLYFVAFLLLLTLPTCRNIEQGTVRVSTEEGYYHIFVHAYENGEGLPAADIIEFYGDSIESPPDAGYAEVTVEELHNMGFKTAEEALAHSDSPDGEVTEVDGHQRGCLGSTSGLTTRVTSAMTPGARLSLAFPLNQSGSGIICGSGTRRCS